MSNVVLDVRGPINATTVYVNNTLVARNVTITLPEVTHVLGTIKTALGEQDMPLYGLVDSMEATIQKIGCDMGLAKICQLRSNNYEFRWTQQVTRTNGKIEVGGCRAYIRAVPKVVPAIEVNPGDSVELDIPLAVTRYQFFCEGEEIVLVDKLAGICRINGEDYASSLGNLL